jgi:alpha-tubulin suppressor-like RCC1 family protein
VRCFGANGYGQLGNTTTDTVTGLANVRGLERGVASLACGADTSCAVLDDAGVVCWGRNTSGQLARPGSLQHSAEPLPLEGVDSAVQSVFVGQTHACLLTSAGQAKCWGENSQGQLGIGVIHPISNVTVPTDVVDADAGFRELALGGYTTCGVTPSGAARCWGAGPIGNPSVVLNTPRPVGVVGLSSGVKGLAVGYNHACVVQDGGVVRCWGDNSRSQLGLPVSTTRLYVPDAAVKGLPASATVGAGLMYSCALTADAGLYCWGTGGLSGVPIEAAFPLVGQDAGVVSFSVGTVNLCGVTPAGGAICWDLTHGAFVTKGAAEVRDTDEGTLN